MHKNTKYNLGIFLGLGIIGGMLIAPDKGEVLRSRFLYSIKKNIRKAGYHLANIVCQQATLLNEAKVASQEVVILAKEKADAILKEITTITT